MPDEAATAMFLTQLLTLCGIRWSLREAVSKLILFWERASELVAFLIPHDEDGIE